MEPAAILVTGARDWTDLELIKTTLSRHEAKEGGPAPILIHGNCVGVDKLSAKAAASLGFTLEAYPAEWARYGRGAGPVCNKEMVQRLNLAKTHFMYAFHDNLDKSRGTKDCVRQDRAAGLAPVIVTHPRVEPTMESVMGPADVEAALAEFLSS